MKKLLLLFLAALTCSAQVTLSQRGAYSLQLNDSGELLVPANGTLSNSVVTLSQLEGAVAAGRVAYFNSSDASGFSPTGTVKGTNYAGPNLESTAFTNTATGVANNEYAAMFISTNVFTSFSSGLMVVDVYAYRAAGTAISINAEAYVVNATTKAEEYEFEPSPAYQVLTTTLTKYTFSVPITDYVSTTNLHLACKIKASIASGTQTIYVVGGGVYPSHFSFQIPGANYATKAEVAAGGTFGPLTTTGTNASLTGTLSADSVSITNFNVDELNIGTLVVTNELSGLTFSSASNVLKQTKYMTLMRPDYGDGAGAVPQTNDYTVATLMHYVFSGNAETNANYVVYLTAAPSDLDTNVNLTADFYVKQGGTDADAMVFHASWANGAVSSVWPPADITNNFTVLTVTPSSAAANDLQGVTGVTLTGWTNLTAGMPLAIKVARLQNGADDAATDVMLRINYGSTQ